jgi:RES domain-containing protein
LPVFDGTGAELVGGRWNSAGRKVIYAGASFAIALLERLVQTGLGRIPAASRFVEIAIPEGLAVEEVDPGALAGWDDPDAEAARRFGDRWLTEGRTAILSVPSAVTRIDRNLVLNPAHPDFARVTAGHEREVAWDRRLFARPAAAAS